MMFEERAYWTEDQILEIVARFRMGIEIGSNVPTVTDAEAAALVVSGIPLSPTELDFLCQQESSPGRCAIPGRSPVN